MKALVCINFKSSAPGVGGLGRVVDLAVDQLAEIINHRNEVDVAPESRRHAREDPCGPDRRCMGQMVQF